MAMRITITIEVERSSLREWGIELREDIGEREY